MTFFKLTQLFLLYSNRNWSLRFKGCWYFSLEVYRVCAFKKIINIKTPRAGACTYLTSTRSVVKEKTTLIKLFNLTQWISVLFAFLKFIHLGIKSLGKKVR